MACLVLLLATAPFTARAADLSPLIGSWRFDATRSTELSPWTGYDLTIAVSGDQVTLDRHLGSGRREFSDTMTVDTVRPSTAQPSTELSSTVIPVAMWPDNRHLGAYLGGDKTKRVHAAWLDAGRILRLSTDLVLATSQGDRSVNILSNYQVSASGTRLTLTELRSTRHRPVVYVFNRVGADKK
ncbi:MAG: hypothetical protein WCR49_01475 [Opitutae bacterium]